MNRPMGVILAVVALLLPAAVRGANWDTDFSKAEAKARDGGRYLLLSFTGSDWSDVSLMLKKEVFDTSAFSQYAATNLVCVLLDLPRRTALPKPLREQNQGLVETYRVDNYPTVLLLSPEGEEVGRAGYREGGAAAYVSNLQDLIVQYEQSHPEKAAAFAKMRETKGLTAEDAYTGPLLEKVRAQENRPPRVWTLSTGKITASLVEEVDGQAVLKRSDGSKLQVATAELGREDQQYIKKLKRPPSPKPGESTEKFVPEW